MNKSMAEIRRHIFKHFATNHLRHEPDIDFSNGTPDLYILVNRIHEQYNEFINGSDIHPSSQLWGTILSFACGNLIALPRSVYLFTTYRKRPSLFRDGILTFPNGLLPLPTSIPDLDDSLESVWDQEIPAWNRQAKRQAMFDVIYEWYHTNQETLLSWYEANKDNLEWNETEWLYQFKDG